MSSVPKPVQAAGDTLKQSMRLFKSRVILAEHVSFGRPRARSELAFCTTLLELHEADQLAMLLVLNVG
jgi:hypothetical protein